MSNKYKSSAHLSPLNIIINGQTKGYTVRHRDTVGRGVERRSGVTGDCLLLVAGVGKWRIPKWECLGVH